MCVDMFNTMIILREKHASKMIGTLTLALCACVQSMSDSGAESERELRLKRQRESELRERALQSLQRRSKQH